MKNFKVTDIILTTYSNLTSLNIDIKELHIAILMYHKEYSDVLEKMLLDTAIKLELLDTILVNIEDEASEVNDYNSIVTIDSIINNWIDSSRKILNNIREITKGD